MPKLDDVSRILAHDHLGEHGSNLCHEFLPMSHSLVASRFKVAPPAACNKLPGFSEPCHVAVCYLQLLPVAKLLAESIVHKRHAPNCVWCKGERLPNEEISGQSHHAVVAQTSPQI